MANQIIIGVTGSNGSGKTSVVNYLVKTRGFKHFSMSGYIVSELNNNGQEINRDNMISMGNVIRKSKGASYIAQQLYIKSVKSGKDSVIESLRNPAEVKFLQGTGNFYLVAIDASAKARYKRISKRKSSKDRISFDKFIEQEKKEMNSDDLSSQQISKCVELADYTLMNNGSFEDLHKSVESVIIKIENA